MAPRMPARVAHPESDLLNRLRRAAQVSGLTADPPSPSESPRAVLVTGRLAQTALEHLRTLQPAAHQNLVGELQALSDPDETALLMTGRGYTYFHVVQFLYEYARHHSGLRDPFAFCAGVGREGGGLNIKPETDIVSLVRLLVSALPEGDDRRNIGLLFQALAPMMLDKVFVTRDFRVEIASGRKDEVGISLRYASRARVVESLRPFELERDAGAFFLNSALQIQGTLQLGLRTFARDFRRDVRMGGLIERRTEGEREGIASACSCGWTVSWKPDIRLRRLKDPGRILAQVRTIYETLHRRDLEVFQERIKALETRVQVLQGEDPFHDMVGKSPRMQRVYRMIQQVAGSDLTVMIRGESGTGKELVARAIHGRGDRRDRPFLPVNCAAFSETLLESELFGHEKGAFTGADRTKPGRFEMANGGTLFLDEVGDIPLTTQVKLLRVLETKAFERVGGTETIRVDVRIIGATNRNLEDLIARGAFREDLYFRLNILLIQLPPLREHREDIPLLAHAILKRIGLRSGKSLRGISRGAVGRLQSLPWPGNIRELQNVVERAVAVYAQGPVLTEADVVHALGIQEPGASASPLNLRQQEVLESIRSAPNGSTVEALMASPAGWEEIGGRSRRTLQNDLRKLVDLGCVTWRKQGSARRYLADPGMPASHP
jgi:DNA-binding NtrC family response regulator